MADANVTDSNISKAYSNSDLKDNTYVFEHANNNLLKDQKYAIHEYITIINDIKNACITSKITKSETIKALCSIYSSHLTFIKYIKDKDINNKGSSEILLGILYATLLDLLHTVLTTDMFQGMTQKIGGKNYDTFITDLICNLVNQLFLKEGDYPMTDIEKINVGKYVKAINLTREKFSTINNKLNELEGKIDDNDEFDAYFRSDGTNGTDSFTNDVVKQFFTPNKFFIVLPDGWSATLDTATSKVYYYNTATGVTQWVPPDSVAPVASTQVAAAAAQVSAAAAQVSAAPSAAPTTPAAPVASTSVAPAAPTTPVDPRTLPQLEIEVNDKTTLLPNVRAVYDLGINSPYDQHLKKVLEQFGCTYVVKNLRLDSELYYKGVLGTFGIYKINDEDVSKKTIEEIKTQIDTAYNNITLSTPLKLTLVYRNTVDRDKSKASVQRKANSVDPASLPQLEYTIPLKKGEVLGITEETSKTVKNQFGCSYVAVTLLPNQILAKKGFTAPFGVYKINDIDVSKITPEDIRKKIQDEIKSDQVKLTLVYLTEAAKQASLDSIASVAAAADGKYPLIINIPAGSSLGIDESSTKQDEIKNFGCSYVVTTLVKSKPTKEKYLDKIGIKVPFGISKLNDTDVSTMEITGINNLYREKQSQGFELTLIYLDEALQKASLEAINQADTASAAVASAAATTAAAAAAPTDQKLKTAQDDMITKSAEMDTAITTNNVIFSDKKAESARQEIIVKAKYAAWNSREAFIKEWNSVNTKDNKINNKMNIDEVWRGKHTAMIPEGMAAFNNITAKVHWSLGRIKRDNAGDTVATAAAAAAAAATAATAGAAGASADPPPPPSGASAGVPAAPPPPPPAGAPAAPPEPPTYEKNQLEQITPWFTWYKDTIQWIINNPDINTYSDKIKNAKSAFYKTYTAFEKDKKNKDTQVGAAVTAFIENNDNHIEPKLGFYSDKLNDEDTKSLKKSFLKHYNDALIASTKDTTDLLKRTAAVKAYDDFKKAWNTLIGDPKNKLQFNTQGAINPNFLEKNKGFGTEKEIDVRNKYMNQETIDASQKIAGFPKNRFGSIQGGVRYSRKNRSHTNKSSTKKTRKNRNY